MGAASTSPHSFLIGRQSRLVLSFALVLAVSDRPQPLGEGDNSLRVD